MDTQRVARPVRLLHWLMALTVALAWIFIYSKGLFDKGSFERNLLKELHMAAGLLVVLLLPLRLYMRRRHPLPAIHPQPDPLTTRLAAAMHGLLYLALLLIPCLGMLYVQSKGQALPVSGIELPQWFAFDKPMAKNIKQIHETLGLYLLYLVILHALAAWWHHFFKRDNTLKRML